MAVRCTFLSIIILIVLSVWKRTTGRADTFSNVRIQKDTITRSVRDTDERDEHGRAVYRRYTVNGVRGRW